MKLSIITHQIRVSLCSSAQWFKKEDPGTQSPLAEKKNDTT